MHAFLQPQAQTPPAAGMVLLDCMVQNDRKLRCQAPNYTQSRYDLRGAALAFAGQLEVCPGGERHLMFPLVFSGNPTPSPLP